MTRKTLLTLFTLTLLVSISACNNKKKGDSIIDSGAGSGTDGAGAGAGGGSVPTLTYASVTGASGVLATPFMVAPDAADNSITNCTISPALPGGLTINQTSCVISGTPSASNEATTYTVTATNSAGTTTATVTLAVEKCPPGYLFAEGNSDLGVNAFCVMQYEAKCTTSLDGDEICPAPSGAPGASKIATSIPEGLPWTAISANDAQLACQNLNELMGAEKKYDLISNGEWMTLARYIEAQSSNWDSGSTFFGSLNLGHSFGSWDDAKCDAQDEYVEEGCVPVDSSWFIHRRTHFILDGQKIWDFSGNVPEWVDWSVESPTNTFTLGPDLSSCLGPSDYDFPMVQQFCWPLLGGSHPNDASPLMSPLVAYDSSYGAGKVWSFGTGRAAQRGGIAGGQQLSGIFSLWLSKGPTDIGEGFRCVYRH
jgi:hypothetical protein